jgi:hypothetical protein
MTDTWRTLPPPFHSYEITRAGLIRKKKNRRPLHWITKDGYPWSPKATTPPYAHLIYPASGTSTNWPVAMLVAMTFLGDPPQPPWTLRYKDGNRYNFHASNLEYRKQVPQTVPPSFPDPEIWAETTALTSPRVHYQISNHGRLRSISKKTGSTKIIKWQAQKTSAYHFTVRISTPTKPLQWAFAHVEVAKAFVPNDAPATKVRVDHKDGNKLNNHHSNLEWVTDAENLARAFEQSTRVRASQNPKSASPYNTPAANPKGPPVPVRDGLIN